MKKLTIVIAACLFVAAAHAQTSGEKKGWPSNERHAFVTECIKEARAGMSEDSARFYCFCMQEIVEAKYPTVDDAAKITEEDVQSEAWKKDVIACLGGTWNTEERVAFISNCKTALEKNESAKGISEFYCECMQYKMEKNYPDPAEAAKLADDIFSTPKWKKIVADCGAF